MEAIYMNLDKSKSTYERLLDCSDNIDSDIKKINELLDDLKRFWVGTKSDEFSNVLDEYNLSFNEISKAYRESSDNLKRTIESYVLIDDQYSTEDM